MKLLTTQDQELNYLRALVYGDTGIGKTTSLETLPQDKTLICVGERGLLPLRHKKFQVLRFDTWSELNSLPTAVTMPDTVKSPQIKAAIEGAKILAIDSLSEASDLCMLHILQVDRPALTKQRTSDRKQAPDNVYEDLMTQEDWGLYLRKMLNLASALCHLPLHVIMTCRSGWSKDREGGDTLRTPGLSGKAAREIGAYVDELFHMESRKDEGGETRVWRTFNDGRILAKDASRALEPFEPANWMTVFEKIFDKKKQEQSK